MPNSKDKHGGTIVQIDPALTETNQNSHKINHHKHRQEHQFSATLWTTVPTYVMEEKTSTHPGTGSTTTARPFADLEKVAN